MVDELDLKSHVLYRDSCENRLKVAHLTEVAHLYCPESKIFFLVLVFFGLWLVFGKTQHHMLWNNSYPFQLVQIKGSRAYGLGFWDEILFGLSFMLSFSQAIV